MPVTTVPFSYPCRNENVLSSTIAVACVAGLFLILLGLLPLRAQDTSATLPYPDRTFPSLYSLPGNSWLGLDRGEVLDRLLLYDSTFRERSQTQWRGLQPLDVATLPKPLSDSAALLLAHPSGATLLFRVMTGNRPEPEPI